MKHGVELKIDVTKIDKARIFEGQKGKYLTMTVFIDTDNQDQYGNNGMITHKKEQGEEKAPILGNAKVFWSENTQYNQQPQYTQAPNQPPAQPQSVPDFDSMDDDLPF